MSAYGLGAIAGGYLGGYLSDRIGARKVQITSLALSGLLLVATSFTTVYGPMLLLLFLYGLISTALFPANDAALARFTPNEIRPKGFALRRLASNLGITIGPTMGGAAILSGLGFLPPEAAARSKLRLKGLSAILKAERRPSSPSDRGRR